MVVLATKVYVSGDARNRALQSLNSIIENALGDLDVSFEVGIRHDQFPSIVLDGADATAAREFLRSEWGEIRTDHENDDLAVGTLESWDESGWTLDAGKPVTIPPTGLQLGPGSPEQLVTRFGLVQHQRIFFVPGDPPKLADRTLDQLFDWTRGAGRVTVNSVTRSEVRATVNRAGHADDIRTIERLGLLEQSIVCQPDTDPPGLLSVLGPYLRGEMRCVIPD